MKASSIKRIVFSDSFSVFMIIMLMTVGMLMYSGQFLQSENLRSLMRVFSVTAVIGLAQMTVMSTGGMNVAVGQIGGLGAILSGVCMVWFGLPVWLTIPLVLLLGCACGTMNGVFTLRVGGVGVASFLATLATSSVFAGITLTITKAKPIYDIPDAFIAIGGGTLWGIPSSIFIMIVISVILWWFFRYLGIGKQMLAFGGNSRAAELYGVRQTNVVMTAHIISGVLAVTAGMMTVMRIQSSQPNIGTDWMLMSMAAPLLGGTRNTGGKVNVLGTILGAVVLAIIANALVHMAADVYWTTLINGLVILAIAALDRIRSARKG